MCLDLEPATYAIQLPRFYLHTYKSVLLFHCTYRS